MSKKVIYIGIDVDDNSFTGAAFLPDTGEMIDFKAKPNASGLAAKLKDLQAKFQDHQLKACYEATYLGFSLQRDLIRLGHHIDVIAPSSIPRQNKSQIKTDRIDASKMAQFCRPSHGAL